MEEQNKSSEEIKAENLLPNTLSEVYNVLNKIHQDLEPSVKLVAILSKSMQLLNFKRVAFKEFQGCRLANIYAITLAPSGSGKDKSIKDLDRHVFVSCLKYQKTKYAEAYTLQEKALKEKFAGKKLENEMKKIRKFTVETNNATPEGIFADALGLKNISIGSIFIKISELSYTIGGSEGKKFLRCIFSCFDGNFDSKSIKSAEKLDNIDFLPISFIGMSDPHDFVRNSNESIRSMLETGLARRAFFAFQSKLTKRKIDEKTERERLFECYKSTKALNEKIFEIFEKIQINSTYAVTENAIDEVILPYKNRLNDLAEEEKDELIKKEIYSRELKALNIACLFACFNHPEKLVIDCDDVTKAIDLVEFLAKDLKKFLNFNPARPDEYQKFYNFLLKNKDKKFGKTAIINNHYQETGFSRKVLRKDYEHILEVLREIASMNGQDIEQKFNMNNTGIEIQLVSKESNSLKTIANKEIEDISPENNKSNPVAVGFLR